jgi:predicted GNAT family N-acyltransferase
MTSIECQEQIYKVPIVNTNKNDQEDDDEEKEQSYHTYILRGLKNDNELKKWTKFCSNVFSYKLNPPPEEYFYRHYVNDPNNSNNSGHSLVRVAFDNRNQIVASCRIFLRTISTGRRQEEEVLNLNCGGIGEVCTDINHRRRGLSTILLEIAIQIMKERKNLHISSLHASLQFFPLYKSLGYISTCTSSSDTNCCNGSGNRWSTVPITVMLEASSLLSHRCTSSSIDNNNNSHRRYSNNNNNNNSGGVVREARFPQDTEQLHQLHKYYSEQRLLGCIVRSKEYWTKYTSEELKGSLFMLVQQQQQQLLVVGKENEEKDKDYVIVAWLSLRSTTTNTSSEDDEDDEGYRRSFQIQEFGMNLSLLPESTKTNNTNEKLSYDDVNSSISIYVAFKTLILHALKEQERQQQQQQYDGGDDVIRERRRRREKISLSLPGFLRDEIYSDYLNSTRSGNNYSNYNNHTRTDDDGNRRDEDDKFFNIDWNSEQFNTDNGWMYQVLSPSDKDDNNNNNNEDDNNNNNNNNNSRTPEREFLDFIRRGKGDVEKEDEQRRQHFVWPSDSF